MAERGDSSLRWGENPVGLERIIFFSDAVFAIAITLLALEIGIPESAGNRTADELAHVVLGKAPNLFAFVLSFFVIGVYWLAHHRIFHYIVRYDLPLLWLNLAFLLGIAFMPFPTGLIARYGNTRFAVGFYALTLALVGLVVSALWGYATRRHRLVPSDLPREIVRVNAVRLLASSGIFVASIGLVFIHPYVAEASWLLQVLVRPAAKRISD